MCDVLDKVENKGKAEGKIEGKNQMALLVKKLLDQSRIEDVKRASENEASLIRWPMMAGLRACWKKSALLSVSCIARPLAGVSWMPTLHLF